MYDEDMEEIEYTDSEDESEEIKYVDSEDELEYDDFDEEDYDEFEVDEFDSDEEKSVKLPEKETYGEYEDEEKTSKLLSGIFITLTALGVVAVLVVFGLWFVKEKKAENNDGLQTISLMHQSTIKANAELAEKVAAEDIRLAEEREAAEEAARQEAEAAAKAEEEAEKELSMVFTPVQETVTAKDATNLRDIPSQGEDSTVMYTLQNGETATRIGISDQGWSKLEYNGETYYAISNYLTTDLTVKPQETVPEDDGIKTVFTACNEQVSPKIEVNLRTLPSVTNPDSVVVVKLQYGEVVTRTGINTDVGWSRVEYNGQTLYCVSSYVYVVE